MRFLNHRVIYSTLFFVLLVALIIISKPSFVFSDDGEVKQFGVGDQKTIVSLGVMVVVLAILSYYVFAVIDLLFSRS